MDAVYFLNGYSSGVISKGLPLKYLFSMELEFIMAYPKFMTIISSKEGYFIKVDIASSSNQWRLVLW